MFKKLFGFDKQEESVDIENNIEQETEATNEEAPVAENDNVLVLEALETPDTTEEEGQEETVEAVDSDIQEPEVEEVQEGNFSINLNLVYSKHRRQSLIRLITL